MQRALLRLCASHPRRAPRYGPLVDGWLWGGAYNARRKLSEYEIETMVTKLEREDIINAVKPEEHGRSAMLPPTPEQENEVLAGVPESMKKPYRLRRPDIVAMLAPCATPPEVRPFAMCPLSVGETEAALVVCSRTRWTRSRTSAWALWRPTCGRGSSPCLPL